MTITNNYSITQLFVTKDVSIIVDSKRITMHLPTLRDLYEDMK